MDIKGDTEEKMDLKSDCETEMQEENRDREKICCAGDNELNNNECCSSKEIAELQKQLEEKSMKCDEYLQALQRTAAEFDNYKKRTAREKEAIYIDALSDTFKAFLPVIDSVERAIQACSGETDAKSLKEGIELISRQIKDTMKNLEVEEIKGPGENFDPELHNAVMHIEDDAYGTNVIVEEFQKGYKCKDRVIRYSMVKVAN